MFEQLSYLHITYASAVFIAFVGALGVLTFNFTNREPPKGA